MRNVRIIVIIIILLSVAACQPTLVSTSTPTPVPSTVTPVAWATPRPTRTPRPIPTFVTETPPPPPAGLPVTTGPTLISNETIATSLPPNVFVFGQSAGGRDLIAWRFGTGERVMLLVGGTHGGAEANTVELAQAFIRHFEQTPDDVLPGIMLLVIPVLNPDGLERGRVAAGRFNGNEVDLNRNWGCDWSDEAYWKNQQVNPGNQAFSEPEAQALATLAGQFRPAAAVFYHSAANGVFEGDCRPGGGVSGQLAAVLGEATGYPYGEPFSAYLVSGTASNWFDGQGIPAVDLELTNSRDTEFDRNLSGVMAVQRWLMSR